jgi:transposase-like protein
MLIKILQSKEEAIKFFEKERFKNGVNCPHCSSNNTIKWGKYKGWQRFRCKNCKKTFNARTRTPFANLKRI